MALFVHDGINSAEDYNSSRMGVGCRLSDVLKFKDKIISKCFELISGFLFTNGIVNSVEDVTSRMLLSVGCWMSPILNMIIFKCFELEG